MTNYNQRAHRVCSRRRKYIVSIWVSLWIISILNQWYQITHTLRFILIPVQNALHRSDTSTRPQAPIRSGAWQRDVRGARGRGRNLRRDARKGWRCQPASPGISRGGGCCLDLVSAGCACDFGVRPPWWLPPAWRPPPDGILPPSSTGTRFLERQASGQRPPAGGWRGHGEVTPAQMHRSPSSWGVFDHAFLCEAQFAGERSKGWTKDQTYRRRRNAISFLVK